MPTDSARSVGLFGGSFDPVHLGHLLLAGDLILAERLDRLIFIPNRVSPFKQDRKTTPAEHRLQMLRLATAGEPRFAVSDVECTRPGPSYSIDTLRHFRSLFPGSRLVFFLGADNLAALHQWREADRLFDLAEIRVLARPGFDLGAISPDSLRLPAGRAGALLRTALHTRLIPVSSTEVRARASEGKPLMGLVPPGVEEYIRAHQLYPTGSHGR